MRTIALLESQRRHESSARGTTASVILHGTLLALAVAATAGSRVRADHSDPILLPLYQWHPAAPRPAGPPRNRATRNPLVPVTAPVVAVPRITTIPSVLPSIPLTPADAFPAPSPGTAGVVTGTPEPNVTGNGGRPFDVRDVDVPAAVLSGQRGPVYPDGLRRVGIEGRVIARFIVGIDGRVEGKPTILEASNDEFTDAVLRYLAAARYRAAVRNGSAVRQLVEQEFDFRINQ